MTPQARASRAKALERAAGGRRVHLISGVTGEGVPEVLNALLAVIGEAKSEEAQEAAVGEWHP